MNILILFSQPWRVGGAETHVEALIQGLQQHKIVLAVNQGSDPQKIKNLAARFPNMRIVEIQARGINIFSWFKHIAKISNLIKNENIQVISAQQRTAGLWAYMLKKMTGVPFVVTMHDSWHRAVMKRMYSGLFGRMVVVSQNLADRLVNEFSFRSENITLINNGIDFETFRASEKEKARRKLGLSPDSKIILHVSRLSTIKGAVSNVIIDSVEQLLQKHPEAQFYIIGEGPLRSQIEQHAASINNKHGQVISVRDFTNEIVTWYSAADVIVGEGRVAIEALACLRPVVAIRNNQTFFGLVTANNINEAMRVNFDGKNFPVTPQKLAEQIDLAFLLNEADRKNVANSVAQQMSIATMAENYAAILRQVIGEPV